MKQSWDLFQIQTNDLMFQCRENLPASLENPWQIDIFLDSKAKCRHFYIFSKFPNAGKTTFMKYLLEKYRCQ